MKKLIHIVLLFALLAVVFLTPPAFAASYSCPTTKCYTSCNNGMTPVSCSCPSCPAGSCTYGATQSQSCSKSGASSASQTRTCNSSLGSGCYGWGSYGSCTATSCQSGYYLSGGSCYPNCSHDCSWGDYSYATSRSCSVTNGTGSQSAYYYCYSYQSGSCSSYYAWDSSYSWDPCYLSTCNTDYYSSNGSTCTSVGNGYYSSSSSTSRSSCTNKPSAASYTGSGGGQNRCPWTLSGTQSCSITNGTGSQTYTQTSVSPHASSNYTTSTGTCNVVSCNSGYRISGNSCVLNTVTASYNLNGGSGTTPSSTSCTPGSSCTLASGATTSFYRAGYVFSGWDSSSPYTTGVTSATISSNTTFYAVWTACSGGTYKPGSGTQASAACSACVGRTQYSGAAASACSTVSAGYFATGCNASNNNCTGQSQCTGATYCSGGVQTSCSGKPEHSEYNTGNGLTANCTWTCNTGYAQSNNVCLQICPYGITTLRVGSLSIPLYGTKNTSHAVAVQYGGGTCYANLANGNAAGALNVNISGTIYHTTN